MQYAKENYDNQINFIKPFIKITKIIMIIVMIINYLFYFDPLKSALKNVLNHKGMIKETSDIPFLFYFFFHK
jgi:L-asparagine transporter-like permease